MELSQYTSDYIKSMNVNSMNINTHKKYKKYYINILKQLYAEMIYSKKIVDKICLSDINNGFIIEPINIRDVAWVPDEIQEHINFSKYYTLKYKKRINNLYNISVCFYLEENNLVEVKHIKNYIKLILTWFTFIVKYSISKCFNNINIKLYLTDYKKFLPQSAVKILDKENVNSGYTSRCAENNEIVIYRKEEWFKVLIHESMHYLGLDFNDNNYNHNLRSIFPIERSDMLLSECYAESWARIFNIYFISLIQTSKYTEFEKLTSYYFNYESSFSALQCNKVLEFMGLSYSDLIGVDDVSIIRRKLYKERSNIFSYYVLTCVIMNDPVEFIIWCKENNTNFIKMDLKNIKYFEKYIMDKYNSRMLLERFTELQKHDKFDRSLRMTIIEII